MKAMLLAAGFGKRMMPLTQNMPKPLLGVRGKPLIEWRIEALAKAGIKDIMINHGYLGQQIVDYLGEGERYGVSLHYSPEKTPLETAGGIAKVIEFFEGNPFVVVNSDVVTDFDFAPLLQHDLKSNLAHLVMIKNPEHNPQGDFSIDAQGKLQLADQNTVTFSGISVLHSDLFSWYRCSEGPLKPLLLKALSDQKITAQVFRGEWVDVGTPERLNEVNKKS